MGILSGPSTGCRLEQIVNSLRHNFAVEIAVVNYPENAA
jgi:hypothetical protein